MKLTKRNILTGLGGLVGLSGIAPASASLLLTPRQTEGPFYPREQDLFADRDNDLVKIAGKARAAGGEVLNLTGTLKDQGGKSISGARVEIWQCDVNARYLHGRDNDGSSARDSGFQGFGHDITDTEGRFSFRTIRPVPYPGRTPHIHAKVITRQGKVALTTQFYVADDPGNGRDGLFRRLSQAERDALSMRLIADSDEGWRTDIVVVI